MEETMPISIEECRRDITKILAEKRIESSDAGITFVITPGSDVFLDRFGLISRQTAGTRFYSRRLGRFERMWSDKRADDATAINAPNDEEDSLVEQIRDILPFALVTSDLALAATAMCSCYETGDHGFNDRFVTPELVWLEGHRL